MARRSGVLKTFAPPASLALALCILIALAVLFEPAAADSAAQPAPAPTEAGASGEAGAERSASTRKAERLARRSERAAEANGTPAKSEEAGSGAATGTPRAGTDASSKATRRAERAERAADRAARKAAGSSGKTGVKNSSRAATGSPAASKGSSERSREERRRAHEEERKKSGRESYKEKKARLAREAVEAAALAAAGSNEGAALQTATAAANGLAASSPEARAAAETPPVLAGEHAVRTTKPRRPGAGSKQLRRTGNAAAGGSFALTSAAAGAAVRNSGANLPAHAPRAAHRAPPAKSSPLVTTVTRIIGVIPTSVWLLIGVLALAALAFATTSRLAAGRVRRLDRQRRELLEDVGLLQGALLPELPARLGPVTTTAAYRPASGPGAGGDFYDVFALPEGLVAVIVGDVSGHGREALPHTTLLRYTLRAYLEAGLGPREALRAAAPALERQLGESFATVVLATWDPRERLLSYSCAGHPHPLLSGLDPNAPIIACSAPPIGAGRPTGTRQTVLSVPGGAVAAFYTDGVIEARTGGELYGTQRLSDTLRELERDAEATTAAALLDRVREQTDRRPDDMAACLLGISGGEGRPVIVSEEIELDGREAGSARTRRFLLAAGVAPGEIDRVLASARAIAADHGNALLQISRGEGSPRLTLTHDNVAPLRARALARTQEVAL
ncbi:MAG: phosphatase [Solirubrobacterales bacterium]|nr:phosphatase [Solirubrobacterales bacterium]